MESTQEPAATGRAIAISQVSAPQVSSEMSFKEWVETERAAGRPLLPDDDPLFGYEVAIGLPREFLHLAWGAFKADFLGRKANTVSKDWRQSFRTHVEKGWLSLWRIDRDGTYLLTTAGVQAQRAQAAAQEATA